MKLRIDVGINCDDPSNRRMFGTARREYENAATPVPGMEIEDSAWKEARKIKGVCLYPADDCYYVEVDADSRNDMDQCEKLKETYESHVWTVHRAVGA